nr:hypothetical protein [Tanacetum cinerariifolium]
MRGACERAYAIGGGILHALRQGVKQSGEIDIAFKIVDEYTVKVNKIKKKTVVVTSDLLALIAEKMKVNKSKEKVVVSSDSEGSEADDFSELKRINTLLAKAFNRRKFYSKPINNLRTSSTS